jgi:hypothetical protein
MVFAMSKHNMSTGLPTIFRSYKAATNLGPDCAIWQAIYATMAHPDLFKGIEIEQDSVPQSFVGGELGCTNPMAHVLAEVKNMYPGHHVSSILSIGAGHARTIQMPDPSLSQQILGTQQVIIMKDMATNSERVAEEMTIRFQGTPGVYFRFNVDQGMQTVGAGDWERLNEVAAHTTVYLGKVETSKRIEQSVQAIRERRATIATLHVGESFASAYVCHCLT